jgi:DNA primase
MEQNNLTNLIEDVLKHTNIVDVISSYIEVKQQGRNYIALCPFHDDKHPSMQISAEKQIFKCFVCGAGGNAIRFVELYEHIPFYEALRKVAEISGYHDDRLLKKTIFANPENKELEPLRKCLADLTSYYQYALATDEGNEGLDYFEKRHLDSNIRNNFLLGYAFKDGKNTIKYLENKGNSLRTIELIGIAGGSGTNFYDKNAGRIIFPITDDDGKVIGYSARKLIDDDTPKYINSPETKLFHKSSVLYNFSRAKQFAKKEGCVYVLEGFMDVFALERIGIHSSVALMGTAFTDEHIKKLRSLNVEVRICLDGDVAGQMGEFRMIEHLRSTGIKHVVVDSRTNKKDPDEILNEDGEEALRIYLNNLISPLNFMFDYYQRINPVKTEEDKRNLIEKFIPILNSVNSTLELSDYIRKLSKITKYDRETIEKFVLDARNKNKDDVIEMMRNFHPERKNVKRLSLVEREVLYQMFNNKVAVDFYEDKIEPFYDTLYKKIADYIIEYAKESDDISIDGLISVIDSSEDKERDNIIKEVTDIAFEKYHRSECTTGYLENLLKTIIEEKKEISSKSQLDKMLVGKTELEKARILNDWAREKLKRKGEK